jgi:hypothetical protein
MTIDQYEQLVQYQNARIVALENNLKITKHLLSLVERKHDIEVKANLDTLDYINSKLFPNG